MTNHAYQKGHINTSFAESNELNHESVEKRIIIVDEKGQEVPEDKGVTTNGDGTGFTDTP